MKLTKKQQQICNGVAESLVSKAERIVDGGYGMDDEPGHNHRWMGDLYTAAGLLEDAAATNSSWLSKLNNAHWEEINASEYADNFWSDVVSLRKLVKGRTK